MFRFLETMQEIDAGGTTSRLRKAQPRKVMSDDRSIWLKLGHATLRPNAKLRRAATLSDAGRAARAFAILAPLARRGVPEAQFRVARAYLEGQGVPPSHSDAMQWCERAAQAGLVEAQSLLAALHLTGAEASPSGSGLFPATQAGAGAREDADAALRWASRAAKGGCADAKALLGYLHVSGPEPMRDAARSEAFYRESAETGSAKGALGYGLVLLQRTDEISTAEAALWIRKAAEAELPFAFYLRGLMLERGIGMRADLPAAMRYYRQSAQRGVLQGQVRLGTALLQGDNIVRDPVEGESWLRRAALSGDAEAAALVGELYASEGDLPPNYAEAVSWYTRAAESGHLAAIRALAALHLKGGVGLSRDPDEAGRWLRRAAEQGDQVAQADLANLVFGGAGRPEDQVRTYTWFEAAARAGDLVAAFNLAICLANGIGTERDERQAVSWLRQAAAQVVDAQYWYGRMLSEGTGVTADPEAGRAWIARAADGGSTDAQILLAEMMVNGRGGPSDHTAALALFKAAGARGHAGAAFATGVMLSGGHEVGMDRTAARDWFRQAAERGHAHAQLMLGRYLAHGLAGPHDPAEARLWLERAGNAGLAEAMADLAELPQPARETKPVRAPIPA